MKRFEKNIANADELCIFMDYGIDAQICDKC